MEKIGLIIGKFAPLHKGHEYLINKALYQVDKLYILVYETNLIDICIEQRMKWIKEVFKNNKIITIKAENPPKQYGMDKKSIHIQLKYLNNILEDNKIKGITHFFSSEEYGKYVAEMLNAENVVVDKERIHISINATTIRNNIKQYKKYMNKLVYEEIMKKTESI